MWLVKHVKIIMEQELETAADIIVTHAHVHFKSGSLFTEKVKSKIYVSFLVQLLLYASIFLSFDP